VKTAGVLDVNTTRTGIACIICTQFVVVSKDDYDFESGADQINQWNWLQSKCWLVDDGIGLLRLCLTRVPTSVRPQSPFAR